jgi:hypothetical protein
VPLEFGLHTNFSRRHSGKEPVARCWKLQHTQCNRSHRIMVLGATDRLSCIVSLSKFYSSGDPLFLGHSPSPAFSTNELFLVPTDFGAISRPIRCLQSNTRANTLPAAVISIPPLLPSRSIGIGVDIDERSVVRSRFTNLISNNSSCTPPILSGDSA